MIQGRALLNKIGHNHRQTAFVQIIAPVHTHRTLLHAVATQRDSGEQANIFKRPVMLVVIQKIRAGIVRDIKVGPAVVVVVAPGRSQSVVMMRIVDASLLRNFFEGAIALVMKE